MTEINPSLFDSLDDNIILCAATYRGHWISHVEHFYLPFSEIDHFITSVFQPSVFDDYTHFYIVFSSRMPYSMNCRSKCVTSIYHRDL